MHESIEVKQLRARLGSYLNQVQEGLTVVVTRQGQAIAELRPYGLEQAGQDVQNGAPQEPSGEQQDKAVPLIQGMSALGLTSYVCQTGPPSSMMVSDEEGEEAKKDTRPEPAMSELQAQESQPEQTMQTEMVAAVGVEAESAEVVSPPPAKPAKHARSRKAKAAASPERRQSRGTSAREKSS